MRRGGGRIRHIATPTLWFQRLVINGDIKMTRVGGNDNCADVGTKHLDFQTMNKHLKFCGVLFAEGRSKIARQVEFSTLLPVTMSNVATHGICSCMSDETSGSPHSATPRRVTLNVRRAAAMSRGCGGLSVLINICSLSTLYTR